MRQRVLIPVILALGLTAVGFVINNHFQAVKEKQAMSGFAALTAEQNLTVTKVVEYLDKHINKVSEENASAMVLGLEQVQRANLAKWQQRYEDEDLQEKIREIYGDHWSPQEILAVAKGDLRSVLLETIAGGYKVETAEGQYFPVIDYTFYRKYHAALTPDVVAYLELMAVESEHPPAKDAALMISWEEILRRATNQERFLRVHGTQRDKHGHGHGEFDSVNPVASVRQLLKRYLGFALYGCDNTPLFDYRTKVMDPEARQAYEEYVLNEEEGEFFKQIKTYLDALAKNDYRLTAEVEAYRKRVFAAW